MQPLGVALVTFAVLFVVGLVVLGRGPGGAKRPAFEVGATSLALAAGLGLFASVFFVDSVGNLVSPLVCEPGERFEMVWTPVPNKPQRHKGELHCSGPGGKRPASAFVPFWVFFDGGLVLFSAIGAARVAASRRKA